MKAAQKSSPGSSEAAEKSGLSPGEMMRLLQFGIIVTDSSGTVIEVSETARQLVAENGAELPEGTTCCSLFGCLQREPIARHCITELAARSKGPLPEVRVDLAPERHSGAVWITAAPVRRDGSQVVMHLRPAAVGDRRRRTRPHWMVAPRLRIHALGRTRVEAEEIAIEGEWLLKRPGQLLKYLVCQRGRPAHVDEIVEALWPEAGLNGRNTVRHYIHSLRERVEPNRSPHTPSSFITSVGSTYMLDPRVSIDVDEFEDLVALGLGESARSENGGLSAVECLERALDLYRGDLISEEPFAEWAFAEREMMRSLAGKALNRLVDHNLERDDLAAATTHLERSTELRPLDADVQMQLIVVYLRRGRHTDAQRRFAAFRQRLLDEFGQEPGFTLADLASGREAGV